LIRETRKEGTRIIELYELIGRYEITGNDCYEVTPFGRQKVSIYYALQRAARYRSTSRPNVMTQKKSELRFLGIVLMIASLVTALLLFARML